MLAFESVIQYYTWFIVYCLDSKVSGKTFRFMTLQCHYIPTSPRIMKDRVRICIVRKEEKRVEI
jgi:hypothetical protein